MLLCQRTTRRRSVDVRSATGKGSRMSSAAKCHAWQSAKQGMSQAAGFRCDSNRCITDRSCMCEFCIPTAEWHSLQDTYLQVFAFLKKGLDLGLCCSLCFCPALLQSLDLGLCMCLSLSAAFLPHPALQGTAHLACSPQMLLHMPVMHLR